MQVTAVTFVPIEGAEQKSLIGIASVTLDNALVVKEIRLIKGKYGVFLGFPSKKGADDKYHDIVFPLDKEFRQTILDAVLKEIAKETDTHSSNQDSGFF